MLSGWAGAGLGMQLHLAPPTNYNGALQVGASAGYRFEHVTVSLLGMADVLALPDTSTRIAAETVAIGATQWLRMPLVGPIVGQIWAGASRTTGPYGHGIGADYGFAFGVPVSRDSSSAWVVALRFDNPNYFSPGEPGVWWGYVFLGDVKTLFMGMSVERIIW